MASGLMIVTGGSRGIGAAISRRLAADGYAVAISYAGNVEGANATVAEIRKSGGRAAAFQAEVSDPSDVIRLFKDAEQALGPLVGLVNNAGESGEAVRTDQQEAEALTRLFAVNAVGTILTSKEAVLRLSTRKGGQGGAIVNISSVAARLGGVGGLAAYAGTKGAVESFTRGLANEVGPEGIRVNAIAPGMIETDMSRPLIADPKVRDGLIAATPLRRLGAPDDIASAVAWLVSPEASFVTGTVVVVSGGR